MTNISALSIAVLLVMGLSSLALISHWLVNRSIAGIGTLAAGLLFSSLGAGFVFLNVAEGVNYWAMVGFVAMLLGQMWQWLGLADFWHARTKMLGFVAKALVFVGVLGIVVSLYQEGIRSHQVSYVKAIVALLSFGSAYTISQALGGSFGMYRGIVRRTSLGAVIAAILFVIHGLYALYYSLVRSGSMAPVEIGFLPSVHELARFEVMLFSISFSMIVIIITAERLQAELKIQKMLDPLTRALNRRAFIEVVKAVLARARRNSEPVSLIMMDIDHFKRINTKYGRTVGDEALSQFADIVTEDRRAQDVFCRFGGEEFVFLLPGTPEEGANLVAKRIRDKIENSSLEPKGIPVKLSVSMGVVTERGDDLDADGMFDMVDRRLHRAQRHRFEKIESA